MTYPEMTTVEKRLCVLLLRKADVGLRDDDFNLVNDAGLTPEEAEEIQLAFWRYNGPPSDSNPKPKPGHHYLPDWALAGFLAHRIGLSLHNDQNGLVPSPG